MTDMKNYFIIGFLLMFLMGCGSKRKIITKKEDVNRKTERIIPLPDKTNENTPAETPNISEVPKKVYANAIEKYIGTYGTIAMEEMRKYKIPASITLAQGILESGSGKGRLSVEGNNHFGIKCHGWKGKKIYHDDDRSQECFRKYNQAKSSFEDHSQFLTRRGRYSKLFELRQDDYKGWAKGLRAAGYATDRKYPQKLISLIERFRLYEYDDMVLNNGKIISSTTPANISHRVTEGDTLYSLSKRYQTTVEDIRRLNDLEDNTISLGQILIIR